MAGVATRLLEQNNVFASLPPNEIAALALPFHLTRQNLADMTGTTVRDVDALRDLAEGPDE